MRWALVLIVGLSLAGCAGAAQGDATPGPSLTPAPTDSPSATHSPRPTRTPAPPTPTPEPPYKLALVSASCTEQSAIGFITCEGFVKNISRQPIEDIVAVVLFYDADRIPVASDEALISYNPLLPGQTSPFSVIARYNPAIAYWRVEFKEILGGTILTRDDRQR